MPRFVVLRHEMPAGDPRPDHYDLMLEQGSVLWTWTCSRLPDEAEPVEAERLPDHRLLYLEFEGDLSGGRGCVRRIDAGDYTLLPTSAGEIAVHLRGAQLHGTLTLARLLDDPSRWRIARRP
jgi:hypothetical protein